MESYRYPESQTHKTLRRLNWVVAPVLVLCGPPGWFLLALWLAYVAEFEPAPLPPSQRRKVPKRDLRQEYRDA